MCGFVRLLVVAPLAFSLQLSSRSTCVRPARAARGRATALRAEPSADEEPEWRDSSKTAISQGGFNTAGEPPIKIQGFSLAKASLAAGTVITTLSFFQFFVSGGSEGLSSLGFIYGIPILLIGCALQYAEIEPVPVEYEGDEEKLEALWELKGPEQLKTIREDVQRHRYGDDAHLDTTLKTLGLVPPGKPYPQLKYLQLSEQDGELGFAMIFESPETPFNDWSTEARVRKYATFFGPGVTADVVKVDAEKRLVAIALMTC